MASVGDLVIGTLLKTGPLEKSLKKVERTIDRAGRRMQSIGSKMTMGVTLPIVAVGAAAIKSSIEFESAFAGVEKTVDGTVLQMDKLRKGIKAMSTEIPASTTEIAKVAEAAGQLGIETDSILAFTRVMIDLGETTNLTAEQAATAMARIANITQLPQDQFDRLGSVLVDLGNNLATTEAEILQMSLRLAGAGKQVNLTQAQILAFAGALSSVGVEAQAGGTAFSRAFIEISKAVDKGGQKLKVLAFVSGQTTKEFAKGFQTDAAGAMVAFIEGLGRMKKEGKSVFEVLETLGLGEIRVRDALLRASGAGDLFRRSLEIGSKAWIDNTALTEEAAKRYATVASQLKTLKNRVLLVAIDLGDALVPAMMQALEAAEPLFRRIEELTRSFSAMEPATQRVVLGIAAVAAAAGPVLFVLGTVASAVSAIVGVIAAASSTIVLAILTIPAALFLWITRWREIGEGTNAIWRFLAEKAVEIFGTMKTAIVQVVSDTVNLITETLVLGFINALATILTFKTKAIHLFQTLKDVVVGNSIIPDMIKAIGAWMSKMGPMMGEAGAQMEAFKNSGARSVGALTGELVTNRKSFDDWARGVTAAIAKVIAKMIILKTIKSTIGRSAGMGFVDSIFAGGFARGGTLEPGEFGIAGEEGPEPIFAGRNPLTVVPSIAAAAGGQVTQHNEINVQGADFSDPEQVRRLMRGVTAELKADTMEAVQMARLSTDTNDRNNRRAA